MKIKYLSLLVASVFILFACGEEEALTIDDSEKKGKDEKKEEVCTYIMVNDSNKVFWTAYKFNEKTGVTGQLMEINTENTEAAESISAMLEGVSFAIPTESVDSKDGDRDPKIREHFFGTFNTPEITGTFADVSGNNTSGKGTVTLMMNDMENDAEFTYEVKNGALTIRTEIDVEDWDGAEAIAALNEVCSELHTGADGESKLWPDVNIVVKSFVEKDCK